MNKTGVVAKSIEEIADDVARKAIESLIEHRAYEWLSDDQIDALEGEIAWLIIGANQS